MKFIDLEKELSTKKRSVNDLIRFIKTRSDENPNYSLLLGAGASITSGIRSASKLIDEWKSELYSSAHPEVSTPTIDEIQLFLESPQNSSWYNNRNEYSSLFEKRYDLPRQRRMFIEDEVRDKTPSLGYAYLVHLIKKKYFKTIFTTNFDDLINEAFYRYSDERPLLCAHDSAISSITVTSKRPKIIKLHGDYLFDDIKSTLRETESLEDNIRNKFIEFAKDYGLIILGYAGNDRSILDVLFYLLKQEDYFKNGIYWCFRKDSEINEDVKKLLWKDKVYYVEIEGYDELMAELNDTLNASELPIERSIISNRQNRFIDSLVGNEYLSNSHSQIIKRDIQRLEEVKEEEFLSSFLESFKSSGDQVSPKTHSDKKGVGAKFRKKSSVEPKPLTLDDKLRLLQLNEKIRNRDFDYTLKKIDSYLHSSDSESFTKELKLLKLECFIETNDKQAAGELLKELTQRSNVKISYLLQLARIEDLYEEKMSLVNEALRMDPHEAMAYFQKADIMYDQLISSFESNVQIDDILENVDLSLQKDPSLQNESWLLKLGVFNLKFGDKKNRSASCDELIKKMELQDPFFPFVVKSRTQLMIDQGKDETTIIKYIDSCLDQKYGYSDKYYLFAKMDVFNHFSNHDEIKRLFTYIDSNYSLDSSYLSRKATIYIEKFDDLTEATKIITEALGYDDSNRLNEQLLRVYLYQAEFEKAKNLLDTNKYLKDNFENWIDYYESTEDYSAALDLINKELGKSSLNKKLLHRQIFLKLKLKDYDSAYTLSRKALEMTNFSPSESIFIINYEISEKLRHNNINKERLMKVIQHPDTSTIEQAAAFHLLGEKSKFYNKLKSAIEKRKSIRYDIKRWVIFEDILEEPRFKKIIGEA